MGQNLYYSCICVYSRMIRSHERRALGALLLLFSRSEPRRPTASCRLAAVRRGDCVRASSWLYSFIVQRIDRYSYSNFCVYLVLLLYQAGSAQLHFYLIEDRCHHGIHVFIAPWVSANIRKVVPCCVCVVTVVFLTMVSVRPVFVALRVFFATTRKNIRPLKPRQHEKRHRMFCQRYTVTINGIGTPSWFCCALNSFFSFNVP